LHLYRHKFLETSRLQHGSVFNPNFEQGFKQNWTAGSGIIYPKGGVDLAGQEMYFGARLQTPAMAACTKRFVRWELE
jgi:hypothetical protein